MYLTAIIDVHSRYIVGWGLSNSLDAANSLEVLKTAIEKHGKPDIVNSDQGSQFTCRQYVEYLKGKETSISMDGKGRALDNVILSGSAAVLSINTFICSLQQMGSVCI